MKANNKEITDKFVHISTQVKHIPTILSEEGYEFYKNNKKDNSKLEKYINDKLIPLSVENNQIVKQDFWNLLLSECISKANYEEIEYILDNHYYSGLLTDIDRFSQSPIVHLMNSRDQKAESIVSKFIEVNKDKFAHVRLTGEHFNQMKVGLRSEDIRYDEERIENILNPLFDNKDVKLFGEIYEDFDIQNIE